MYNAVQCDRHSIFMQNTAILCAPLIRVPSEAWLFTIPHSNINIHYPARYFDDSVIIIWAPVCSPTYAYQISLPAFYAIFIMCRRDIVNECRIYIVDVRNTDLPFVGWPPRDSGTIQSRIYEISDDWGRSCNAVDLAMPFWDASRSWATRQRSWKRIHLCVTYDWSSYCCLHCWLYYNLPTPRSAITKLNIKFGINYDEAG